MVLEQSPITLSELKEIFCFSLYNKPCPSLSMCLDSKIEWSNRGGCRKKVGSHAELRGTLVRSQGLAYLDRVRLNPYLNFKVR